MGSKDVRNKDSHSIATLLKIKILEAKKLYDKVNEASWESSYIELVEKKLLK